MQPERASGRGARGGRSTGRSEGRNGKHPAPDNVPVRQTIGFAATPPPAPEPTPAARFHFVGLCLVGKTVTVEVSAG